LADAKAAGARSHLRRGEIRAVSDSFSRYASLIIMPSPVAIIAVSIPIPTIVVIAMVPVWVAVIGAATDVDPDISSSR